MTKVLYDFNAFLRAPYSGISRYFAEISSRVTSSGIDAEVFAPLHNNQHIPKSHRGIFVPRFPRSGEVYGFFSEILLKKKLMSFKPDIIHETFYSTRRYGRNSPKRVYTVHDMIPELFPEKFDNYSAIFNARRKAFTSDGHFVVISESTKKDFLRLFPIDDNRVKVIYHGGPQPYAHQNIRQVNRVLFVGSRDGYKNFEGLCGSLAEVINEVGPIRLSIVGGGSLKKVEIDRMNNIAGLTYWQRDISEQELLIEYQKASVFVFPSMYEGFGLPILEAMAAGCPVACSNTSSFPEISGDAAIAFTPTSSKSIANALIHILCGSYNVDLMREKGFERCSMFHWSKSAEAHAALYSSVL